MKRVSVIIALLWIVVSVAAKEYEILGRIFDAETEQRLGGATLSVVNPANGKIHGQGRDSYSGVKPMKENWFLLKFWTESNDSIALELRIEQPGYKGARIPLEVGRSFPTRTELREPIWLVSDTSEMTASMVRQLKEVTVIGTRIKMVVRGDTLVYDAAAFQLGEGSMLDALVSQLPGVTLNNRGQISVNGKFVSSLLVDGKDFFSGDPNIALRNLPAYVVKNIKVYDRAAATNRKKTGPSEEDDLVMDVILKKQYQQGFLGNIEGGYGSDERYLGRLFGLEYARNGRIGIFANLNNINNDSRGPGLWGQEWRENERSNEGERRILKTGVDWQWTLFSNRDSAGEEINGMSIDGSATYTLEHKSLTELTAFTPVLNGTSRFGRSQGDTRNRTEQFDGSLYISGNVNKSIYVALAPSFSYQSGYNNLTSTGADFAVNPEESTRGEAVDSVRGAVESGYSQKNRLIYRENRDQLSTRRRTATQGNLNISIGNAYLYGRQLNVYFDWEYRNLRYHDLDNRLIDYRLDPDANIRSQLRTTAPGQSLRLSPSLRYIKKFTSEKGSTELHTYYRFARSREKGEQEVYRLTDSDMSLEEALIDIGNSFHSLLNSTENSLIAEATGGYALGENWKLSLRTVEQLKYLHRNLHYERAAIDTAMCRNNLLFTPDVTVAFINDGGSKRTYELRFRAENTPVTMTRLLRTTDNTDPLNIYLGNPDLRSSTTYQAGARYELRRQLAEQVLSARFNYYYYANRVGQLKIFDPMSSVSTYMPVNVEGSYRLNGSLDFTTPFPAASKRFWLSTTTKCDYLHNPDLISESTPMAAIKETIHNLALTEEVRLQWRVAKGYTLGINLGSVWRRASSTREEIQTVNAFDLRGGLTANLTLPGEIIFSTDMTATGRTGYDDEALNTTEWTWNARLERTWLKGRLITKLDAYDILNQTGKVDVRINSLGRTETWTNTMSRYILLSMAWRFSIMP